MLPEYEMLKRLENGEVVLPPLAFRYESNVIGNGGADAVVRATWGGQEIGQFAVVYKSTATPKMVQNAIYTLRRLELPRGVEPLLMVPFLSEECLGGLEKERISAIDLCQNGVIFVDRKLAVFRTGGKNQFTSSAPIKNIYRKRSSLVPRVFLSRPRFEAVQEVLREVNARRRFGGPLTLPTVSKALKAMEEDLLIQRESGIGLIQPKKLLATLSENYEPPIISNRTRLKIPGDMATVLARLREEAATQLMPWVVTGLSSVNRYAVMQRGEMVSVYCPRFKEIVPRLGGQETERFPNLELLETTDERVYFDTTEEDGICWAGATQTYLELMAGDKRDRETAEQVMVGILGRIERRTS